MTNYSVKTVQEFISVSQDIAQPHLMTITAAIREAIPEADERIGYGKPFYKYHGWVAGMDVYTQHVGVEIWDGLSPEEQNELEGKGYKTGSKTFQIRYDQTVPVTIIQRLVKAQAKKNQEKAASKSNKA